MNSPSLAAQAVANGPMTVAPPSFQGHGWLVVANLTTMTAATLIAAMVVTFLLRDGWIYRMRERGLTPARLWRLIGLLFATGIMLRCGVEAANIWGWDPHRPGETAGYLLAKRLVDPVAVCCGVAGLSLFIVSLPGMLVQLRKEPLPLAMWQSLPIMRNMVALALLSLIAAIGVVSTR